jgi:hypothetical protein
VVFRDLDLVNFMDREMGREDCKRIWLKMYLDFLLNVNFKLWHDFKITSSSISQARQNTEV